MLPQMSHLYPRVVTKYPKAVTKEDDFTFKNKGLPHLNSNKQSLNKYTTTLLLLICDKFKYTINLKLWYSWIYRIRWGAEMKIIAAVNNKGGVGKTKLSELLAEYAARFMEKRILAIDFDPQCNFSNRYLCMEIDPATPEGTMPPIHPSFEDDMNYDDNWDGRSSIADTFYAESVLPYPTPIKNLDIAPGHHSKLLAVQEIKRTEIKEKIQNHLNNFLSGDDVKECYDAVVIDTAPSKCPLTLGAIRAATHLVIPAVMEPKSIEGIYGMLQLWKQERLRRDSSDSKLELVGILPNQFKKNTTLHNDLLNDLKNHEIIGKYMLPVQLGHRIVFAEVDSQSSTENHTYTNIPSVFDLPTDNVARKEAIEVCEHILNRIFNHG